MLTHPPSPPHGVYLFFFWDEVAGYFKGIFSISLMFAQRSHLDVGNPAMTPHRPCNLRFITLKPAGRSVHKAKPVTPTRSLSIFMFAYNYHNTHRTACIFYQSFCVVVILTLEFFLLVRTKTEKGKSWDSGATMPKESSCMKNIDKAPIEVV